MKKEFLKQKCPRCGGNLYLERDYYTEGIFVSWYEQVTCLQCGFAYSKKSPEPAVKQLVTT
jgi:predicted nucleic-acid-binding Zn-ribbon protein